MKAQAVHENVSVQDYLAGEQQTEIRHEYINGTTHALGGASPSHNLIAGNVFVALHAAARNSPCQVFMADMKVYLNIAGEDVFYYPDLLVSCDPEDNEDYYRTRPCLIVEVLSPTTERIDRREKFMAYTSLPSLQEYVLIAQDRQAVMVFRQKKSWKLELFQGGEQFSSSNCLKCTLPLVEVYHGVEL
ncbi:Uma2 family endonuclease [Candidatus Electrothrix sp.]|uniref:Uma2 family endonuclease n=1 Tax=Candidatus Electrothrix sp. TaxID=2170559 RepID=UPI0040573373